MPRAPTLQAEDPALLRTYRASLSDLAALRMHPDLMEGATLPAAGLPWFMALFGRDSLITSFQALPYLPGLAATTLRVLAARQAHARDDFHEQEPGKILHELRFGELTARGERPIRRTSEPPTPHRCSWSCWTSTTAGRATTSWCAGWSPTPAQPRWIADSGDARRRRLRRVRTPQPGQRTDQPVLEGQLGLDPVRRRHLARGPIATCEIQGYVYDAQRRSRGSHARSGPTTPSPIVWNAGRRATRRFRRDFWMPERGCHALALDGDKQQVDSLTSNIGHLLWSGLLDEAEAAATAERLLDDAALLGLGRPHARRAEAGYNPLGYHTGTVWPHDNSLIAAGLARYGHHEAAQIAAAILAAAPYFEHRLPEVFAGFPLR